MSLFFSNFFCIYRNQSFIVIYYFFDVFFCFKRTARFREADATDEQLYEPVDREINSKTQQRITDESTEEVNEIAEAVAETDVETQS